MNTGQTLAHYEIIRALGKGGMGEVYLAQDTKLDRQVAVKVLPDTVRQDEECLARFRREAKAAASLKHPNIATIYSLEEADDVLFIVMEHVEGETLSEKIPKDGMDIDEFFTTFIPLANALSHAHEQGRIHRDLKPANIMIAADGTPKILDFGLARIIDPDPVQGAYESDSAKDIESQAPTMTIKAEAQGVPSLTRGGQLMGTPMYMSPEQAEREETDARTDIFSLGVVMYEALTGQRPFEGKTLESIIGKIIEAEPKPVTALIPVLPYTLWRTIRGCLEKDREDRIPTSRRLYKELLDVQQDVQAGTMLVDASTIPEPMQKAVPFWRQPAAIGFAVLMLLFGSVATWFLKAVPEMPLRKFQWPIEDLRRPVISPDGTMVAYIAGNPERLWIRDLGHTSPREISDSEGISGWPFWSPGSDYVGYFVQDELRKVTVQGEAGIRVCELPGRNTGRYGAWSPEGTIIFGMGGTSDINLFEVSDQGGEPKLWMQPDTSRGEIGIYTPLVLPDGKHYVFSVVKKGGAWDLIVQSGTIRQTITSTQNDRLLFPHYDGSGHIVYQRGYPASNGIWAIPFDLSTLKVTGEPFLVAEDGDYPSVSSDGTLVYLAAQLESGPRLQQLVWVDRSGNVQETIGQPQYGILNPAISPDGSRVAVSGEEQSGRDIWVHDVIRGTKTRLTTDQTIQTQPAWSPDGDYIGFVTTQNDPGNIVTIAADRGGTVSPLVTGPLDESGPQWSPDAHYLIYYVVDPETKRDLWYLQLSGGQTPQSFLKTPYEETMPVFSPDGRFVAYHSNESERFEVYVMSFPEGERKWLVSVNGGRYPKWNRTGDELFYIEGNTMMSVAVKTQPVFWADIPRPLFTGEQVDATLSDDTRFALPLYDVTANGQRFVVVQNVGQGEEAAPKITVVENWYAEFRDRE